jgi:hypothetical protein
MWIDSMPALVQWPELFFSAGSLGVHRFRYRPYCHVITSKPCRPFCHLKYSHGNQTPRFSVLSDLGLAFRIITFSD